MCLCFARFRSHKPPNRMPCRRIEKEPGFSSYDECSFLVLNNPMQSPNLLWDEKINNIARLNRDVVFCWLIISHPSNFVNTQSSWCVRLRRNGNSVGKKFSAKGGEFVRIPSDPVYFWRGKAALVDGFCLHFVRGCGIMETRKEFHRIYLFYIQRRHKKKIGPRICRGPIYRWGITFCGGPRNPDRF